MLDFLFQFFVLNTAFSVIGNEIAQKLASIGGIWFNVLYAWILYAVYDDWQDNDLPFDQIGSYLVCCFVVSNAYITIMELISHVSFINVPTCSFLEKVTSMLLKVTFPYMLWCYVSVPINLAFNMAINHVFGPCSVWYCTWGAGFLAFLVTGVVVSYVCQSPGMVRAGRTKRKYTRRATPVAKRTRSATVEKRSHSAPRRK